MKPTMIISGGQTGADMGGLLGARESGIATGGQAPLGWRTELGPNPGLADFGLTESGDSGYYARTLANVRDSHGTVLFGDMGSSGSRLTLRILRGQQRPHIVNPSVQELREFIVNERIEMLNVAGNRESVSPGLQEKVRTLIIEAFSPS